MEARERELVEYEEADGSSPFRGWFSGLRDRKARARIVARLVRLRQGNFGDAKSLGDGVSELRLDFGPGYRVYFALDGERIVLLLLGGDKSTQQSDIRKAVGYWQRYQEE